MDNLYLQNLITLRKQPDLEIFDTVQSGKEFYEKWMRLAEAVEEKSKQCKLASDQLEQEIEELEDQKNQCYQNKDTLEKDRDTAKASLDGIDARLQDLNQDLVLAEKEAAELEKKIKKLEKRKKAYDVIRYIPIVNIASEIAAAIDNTRSELKKKKRSRELFEKQKRDYLMQREETESEKNHLEEQIEKNQSDIMQLEKQLKSLIDRREEEAKAMIVWEDRKKYCSELAEEMKHLVSMEADISEFWNLIQNNPPAFDLMEGE